MIDVVRVWENGELVAMEVRDYLEDLIDPIIYVVWEKKNGTTAPTKEEAVVLYEEIKSIS